MKKIVFTHRRIVSSIPVKLLFVFLVLITTTAIGQDDNMDNVPLIERDLFFGLPEISNGKLSPDGEWISFKKEHQGIDRIWIKKFNEPFEKAVPITNNQNPVKEYFWTEDSRYILYVKDQKGNENYNVYAVSPTDKAEKETGMPPAQNLTPMEGVRVQIEAVSRKNPNIIWVGINKRDHAWHDLYELDITTGKLTLLYENKHRITGWSFDWDENPRLAYRTNEEGFSEILRIDSTIEFTKIYETNLQEKAYVEGWTADNSQFYLVSNKGGVNFSTLYKMNPETKELEKVESDPQNKVDFGKLFLDQNDREIIYTSYFYHKRERNWKKKDWEEMYAYLKKEFEGRDLSFTSFTSDYKEMLLTLRGDRYAAETYYFNRETKELIFQYTKRPKLKEIEQYLAPMKPITYLSSDGLEIPAYLTIPVGKRQKNLPLVVLVHGGPKGIRDYWEYNPLVQVLANRGYAVLQPNFRSSGGFGKAFLNAGDKEWGRKMQDDITWGVNYLIKEGIADPNRIAIGGSNYGGYAALAGLAFTPELYACAIDVVGPSNLFTLLESIPPYWEAGRKRLYEMLGDPTTKEGRRLLKKASPIFSVDKIEKPLLIIQGANDPRVKKTESDQIVVELRDKGKEVSYILANDEGHGFRKPLNKLATWASVEQFLAEHLGGRWQKNIAPQVAQKLKEITQDINKVVYQKPEEFDTKLPPFTSNFKEGKYEYELDFEIQKRIVPMKMTRSVEKTDGKWVISDYIQSSEKALESKNTFTLTSGQPTQVLMEREKRNVLIDVDEEVLVATIRDNKAVYRLSGVYLPTVAVVDLVVAHLPLKMGYELSFQTFNTIDRELEDMKLQVIGKEEGKWRVNVFNRTSKKEVFHLWIDPDRKIATKIKQFAPGLTNTQITYKLKE